MLAQRARTATAAVWVLAIVGGVGGRRKREGLDGVGRRVDGARRARLCGAWIRRVGPSRAGETASLERRQRYVVSGCGKRREKRRKEVVDCGGGGRVVGGVNSTHHDRCLSATTAPSNLEAEGRGLLRRQQRGPRQALPVLTVWSIDDHASCLISLIS